MARTLMITIRVDEAEHALFKGAAAAVPVSMSEYARDAMLARMALEGLRGPVEFVAAVDEAAVVATQTAADMSPRVVRSPADVPAAVERAARSANPAPRPFTPYTKDEQTGKAKKARVVAVPACRHGLLRCKVCGSW